MDTLFRNTPGGVPGKDVCLVRATTSLLLSSLELSDTKVYEP